MQVFSGLPEIERKKVSIICNYLVLRYIGPEYSPGIKFIMSIQHLPMMMGAKMLKSELEPM